jgi:enediyne biosynthesis protein E4
MTDHHDEHIEETDDSAVGKAFWRSLAVIIVAAGVGGAWWLLNQKPDERVEPVAAKRPEAKIREKSKVEPPNATFTDVTKESGVDFVHFNGAMGKKLLPETMGGGVAIFDFNNDGFQDLLFTNGRPWEWDEGKPGSPIEKPTLKLYQNDGKGKFTDATKQAGLDVSLYAMGMACGDYDNDGWVDLYITGVPHESAPKKGSNRLFHNVKGKFVDVTESAGVAGRVGGWSTAAAWVDVDNDAKLDLVCVEYVDWNRDYDLSQPFTLKGHGRGYGRPTNFPGAQPYLFHNVGGGKFTDVASKVGLHLQDYMGHATGKSLGIAPIDVNGDGWIDLVVANDMVQNFLFLNQKDGTFKEIGADASIAFDAGGVARGAMGIDAGYFRNDGSLAVGIGNFANEMTAFYMLQQSDPIIFKDTAISCGVGPPSRVYLKFGLFFFDYDLDGRLDLFEANGHLENDISKVQESQTHAQPAQLFWNAGPDQPDEFVDVPASKMGEDLRRPMVGRGAAFGDLDGDGDLEGVIAACGGPCRVLRNDQKLGRNWMRLKLVGNGVTSNRDAVGAWIDAIVGNETIRRQVMPTRSYLSQCELPVTIGFGDKKPDALRIRWPDGRIQELKDLPLGKTTTIEQAKPAGKSG